MGVLAVRGESGSGSDVEADVFVAGAWSIGEIVRWADDMAEANRGSCVWRLWVVPGQAKGQCS